MRQRVELALADHVLPEIDAGGARDLDAVEGDVRRAAHGDRDRERVPQGRGGDDVARLDPLPRERHEAVDELLGELAETARIVGRRRDHVQRLHAEHGDERLHGVVGEHAAAAALSGAGVERHAACAAPGSGSPATWNAVTRSMRSPVVGSVPGLIEPSERNTAGSSRSSTAASVPTGGLSHATTAIKPFTSFAFRCASIASFASSRPIREIPHAVGAVQLSVGHAEGVRGRDQADRQVVAADPRRERRLDRFDLSDDAEVALAVTEVPGHGPDRLMDLERILSEKARGADALDVASRVPGDESISGIGTSFIAPAIRTIPVGSCAVMRRRTTRMTPNDFWPGKTNQGATPPPERV